jgi:hypothetical protein
MTISRIWHAFGLQPHRRDTFKLSPDPQLIDKVRDIVGLYMNPPEHALVLCVDEKSQIQALDRTQPLLPLQPGQVERGSRPNPQRSPTEPSPMHPFRFEKGTSLRRAFVKSWFCCIWHPPFRNMFCFSQRATSESSPS